jgi:hypothetical protein
VDIITPLHVRRNVTTYPQQTINMPAGESGSTFLISWDIEISEYNYKKLEPDPRHAARA